ncbi:hypothetical protein P0136_11970 [Lentisphaerota bacterium ZTH]|nr:hypothetical protein JYG24_10520 [Lentisphaerota bacterium]WET06074.1 hypothetical protein P0136_11970 [Lentisphaerota bacterium ZTH]
MKKIKNLKSIYAFLFVLTFLLTAMITLASSTYLIKDSQGKDIRYKIISESSDDDFSRCGLRIELLEPVDQKTLKKIAMQLRSNRQHFSYLWVWYYIKDLNSDKWVWAYSYFQPAGLDLNIIGSPLSKINKLKKATVKQHHDLIIGRWLDDTPGFEHLISIYTANGKIYVQTNYIDGSYGVDELNTQKEDGKIRYKKISNPKSEYFMIEKNGNIVVFDQQGKFREDEYIFPLTKKVKKTNN